MESSSSNIVQPAHVIPAYVQPVDTQPAYAQPASILTNDAAVGAELNDEEIDNMLAELPMVVHVAPSGLFATYYAHHGGDSSYLSEAHDNAQGRHLTIVAADDDASYEDGAGPAGAVPFVSSTAGNATDAVENATQSVDATTEGNIE